jgi:hypothetical protein
MKKYLILFAILIGVSGVFQTLQSYMTYQKFNEILDELINVDHPPELETLKKSVIEKSYEVGIFMVPEQIQATLTDTERNTMAGALLAPQGIRQTNRLLTLDLYYQAQIFYFPKPYSLHREHVYTIRSEIPSSPLDPPVDP